MGSKVGQLLDFGNFSHQRYCINCKYCCFYFSLTNQAYILLDKVIK